MALDQSSYEFQAPQFFDSWENATRDDGADSFFDALDRLDTNDRESAGCESRRNTYLLPGNNCNSHDQTCPITEPVNSRNAEDIGSISMEVPETRRLSLKRKARTLKDRNEIIPVGHHNRKGPLKSMQFLPTIAESPVLLTKNRVRPKTTPESDKKNRLILKPHRKPKIGVCVKPIPKPPTIPEPFNLTEAGSHTHNCYDESENENRPTLSITPGRRYMKKKRVEVHKCYDESYNENRSTPSVTPGKKLLKRKGAEENGYRFEFRAKSPTVLRKDPFRPEVPHRILEAVGPQLTTEERAKKRSAKCSIKNKMKELEDNLFVFKAQPAPKANSSFLSTASSSHRNFCNSSMASSIRSCVSDRSMAFSFYERDMEMLRRREERMKQVDTPKWDFKAKEPTVLSKEPFWPEFESRTIPEGSAPGLATEERAKQRQEFEQKKKQAAERKQALLDELRKVEEEELREYRRTLEFKATVIRK